MNILDELRKLEDADWKEAEVQRVDFNSKVLSVHADIQSSLQKIENEVNASWKESTRILERYTPTKFYQVPGVNMTVSWGMRHPQADVNRILINDWSKGCDHYRAFENLSLTDKVKALGLLQKMLGEVKVNDQTA